MCPAAQEAPGRSSKCLRHVGRERRLLGCGAELAGSVAVSAMLPHASTGRAVRRQSVAQVAVQCYEARCHGLGSSSRSVRDGSTHVTAHTNSVTHALTPARPRNAVCAPWRPCQAPRGGHWRPADQCGCGTITGPDDPRSNNFSWGGLVVWSLRTKAVRRKVYPCTGPFEADGVGASAMWVVYRLGRV